MIFVDDQIVKSQLSSKYFIISYYLSGKRDPALSTNAEVDIKNNPFGGFFSTLLNHSRDQQFTLNHLTTIQHFASTAISGDKAGLIGYSMGGYGAVNTLGGCYNFTNATTSVFTGIKDAEQIKKITTLLNPLGFYSPPLAA